jgi:uncharacterized membrane protein YsdA (DUF1294 family)
VTPTPILSPTHEALLAAMVALSMLAYVLYAVDKSAARRGKRRIPEATLHVVDVLGGWPGALIARHALRHKTRKQPFRSVFWLTVVLNCAAVAWVLAGTPGLPN